MSCKTVSVRRLPRRLDRRAGNVSASPSILKVFTGALVVLTQVGCLSDLLGGSEGPEVKAQSAALTYGQIRGQACVQADQDQLQGYVLYANSSIAIGARAQVVGGDVGVGNPDVAPSPRLLLNQRATISNTNRAVAASINLFNNVRTGPLATDSLTKGTNVTHGAVSGFPDTTPILPEAGTPTPGAANIGIPDPQVERTLAPGAYRDVRVPANKTLRLSGGNYVFASLTVGNTATLIVEGANTVVTVRDGILIRPNANVTLDEGLSAKDFYLRTNAATSELNETAGPAIDVFQNSTVQALIVAPNAWVRFGNDTVFTGAAIFDRGIWGGPSQINFQDGIPGEDCQEWDCATLDVDDENPCTADTCDVELGEQHSNLADGTACTLAGVAEAACLNVTCTELCVDERQTREGNPLEDPNAPRTSPIVNFDEFPTDAGYYLVKYTDGCMKFNPLWFWSVQAVTDGEYTWFLVGDNDRENQLAVLPGTVGFYPGQGPTPRDQPGFQTFAACVTANKALPPIVINHADDTPLGIHLADHPYTDNREGEGQVNPTWTITPFGACGL